MKQNKWKLYNSN